MSQVSSPGEDRPLFRSPRIGPHTPRNAQHKAIVGTLRKYVTSVTIRALRFLRCWFSSRKHSRFMLVAVAVVHPCVAFCHAEVRST